MLYFFNLSLIAIIEKNKITATRNITFSIPMPFLLLRTARRSGNTITIMPKPTIISFAFLDIPCFILLS